MDQEPAIQRAHREGKAVRFVAPVWTPKLHAVPLDPRPSQNFVEVQNQLASRDLRAHQQQKPREAVNVPVLVECAPVKPADVIVLAIGVIVSALRAPHRYRP